MDRRRRDGDRDRAQHDHAQGDRAQDEVRRSDEPHADEPPLRTSWHGRSLLGHTFEQDLDPEVARVDRSERDVRGLPETSGRLETPLAQTVRFAALSARPTPRQVARVRKDAAAGRYGDGWGESLDRRSPSPWTMALSAAAVFGGVLLIVAVVTAIQGDGETALLGLGSAVVAAVAFGGIAFAVATISRGRRWRRHVQAAAFAEANGLGLRFTVDAEALPPLVRGDAPESGTRTAHADVLAGTVRGQQLLAGTRSTEAAGADGVTTTHLVWAAIRLDPALATRAPLWRTLQQRCDALLSRGAMLVERDDDWVMVGVRHLEGALTRTEVLLAAIDVVLEIHTGEPV